MGSSVLLVLLLLLILPDLILEILGILRITVGNNNTNSNSNSNGRIQHPTGNIPSMKYSILLLVVGGACGK
jgi:hypothetical protein